MAKGQLYIHTIHKHENAHKKDSDNERREDGRDGQTVMSAFVFGQPERI